MTLRYTTHGGIAITGNNQGLESTWLWEHMAIKQGYLVCGQRLGGRVGLSRSQGNVGIVSEKL